jgi:hypothetical protein
MRTPQLLLTIAATLLVLLGGCKKDDPATVDLGYAYFPKDSGHWIEYNVDSLRVGDGESTTWNYTIREVVTDAFTDLEGRPAQRVIRYTKDSSNAWIPKDVWWQTRDNVRAERSEENMRRIKLIFPPRTTSLWNTNATNTTRAFELTYEEVDVPWSVNGMTFDSTVLVVGTYESNLINTKIYKERYAKHVGLVYREVDSSQTQFGNNGSYDRYQVVYTITAHGQ